MIKKFKYKNLSIIILTLFVSCVFAKYNTNSKTFRIKIHTIKSDYKKEEELLLKLPVRGLVKKDKYSDHGIEEEYLINYPDSSIFYISNEIEYGSKLNFENRFNSGYSNYNNIKNKMIDTVSIQGKEPNGKRFWKEIILGDIVLGYTNSSKQMKEKFDQAIMQINRN